MSLRLRDTTKWIWCLLALYSGPIWSPVKSVTVRPGAKIPATVEAQAKFFQDFFSVQLSPYKIEFGHVCEDPNTWEQRYEKKDFKNHRDMGKVRWGDKKGGYGEHYWDLNHAGHAGNHGDDRYGDSDDGSYNSHDNGDTYDEPSEQSPNFGNEYDPEKSDYDESNRAKRAHTRAKAEEKGEESNEEIQKVKPKYARKNIEQQTTTTHKIETVEEKQTEADKKPAKPKRQYKPVHQEQDYEEDYQQPRDLKPKETELQQQPSQYVTRRQPEHYVPYEGGAGVRQHQQPEVAAASAPRLFLEPATGHVVDRTTGQAYILQPIVPNNNYN